VKSAQSHLKALDDGRRWRHDGRWVDNIARDPAFSRFAATAAAYYDVIADPSRRAELTFESPTSGQPVARHWHLPCDLAELRAGRAHMEAMAALTYGMVGRSPDHVASTLVGMMMGVDVLAEHDARGAAAFADYFRHARDNDLYLAYVIVNPQADRSRSAAGQPTPGLVAQIVDESAAGIVVRGAKMLATSAVGANELIVSGIQPLAPGDEACAFTAAVPMNAPGLHFLSRRSYEAAARSAFDNPLSWRFDENDAVVVFEDVAIPWERVFLNRNLAAAQAQWHDTRAHVYQNWQSLVRLTVKLRFLLGMARRIAEVSGTLAMPAVRDTLGELASKAALMDAAVAGMEAAGESYRGYFVPHRGMLCAGQAAAQRLYPEVIHTLRELSGGGLIMLPSSEADLLDPASRDLVLGAQASPAATPLERVRFFKLAWDAIGSEFGSRHLQYEMFYSGAPFVLNGHNFRFYDWSRATSLLDECLAGIAMPQSGAGPNAV
jgi:4-hydroxyphenylacetate 3-monooxygenase